MYMRMLTCETESGFWRSQYGHIPDGGGSTLCQYLPTYLPNKSLAQLYHTISKADRSQMPILGYETHRNRKILDRAFAMALVGGSEAALLSSFLDQGAQSPADHPYGPAAELIRGYVTAPNPVHCRRTLDRFAYPMLDSTETRDLDQVSYRWGKRLRPELQPKDRPIIMVDQLWLWLLQDGIISRSLEARIPICIRDILAIK